MILTSLICNPKNSLKFPSEQPLADISTSQIQPQRLKFSNDSRYSQKMPLNPKAIPKVELSKKILP